MVYGICAALTWALDTVILSIALASSTFFSTELAIALAAFTSTFLHDATSAVFMFIYMAVKRKLKATWDLLKTKYGWWIVAAAVVGASLGMTGYVLAINNIGAAYTAAISAFFPAYGALLAHFVLKEEMRWYNWLGLAICLVGVVALSWEPAPDIPGDWFVGLAGAFVCVFGWGTEAVIIAWGLRTAEVDDENALQIRQTTSAIVYACVLLPILGGWAPTLDAAFSDAMPVVMAAAVAGTVSYLFYYKAIAQIGAAKAMALNITYCAWAIPFSLVLLGSIPQVMGIVWAVVIIIGAVMAATNVRELLTRSHEVEGAVKELEEH